MAIPLKKFAMQCEEIALTNGSITPATSPTATLYDISRHWRDLCNATTFKSLTLKGWTEREECAAEVIIASLVYLQRIGCSDVEKLVRDTLARHGQQAL